MENYIPGDTETNHVLGLIDKFCLDKKEYVTELEISNDTDVPDLVNLIKTVVASGTEKNAKMSLLRSTEALGIQAQIVGEFTAQKGVWVYNETCLSDHFTRWESLPGVSSGNSSLDPITVARTGPRLVSLISSQPISALKNLYPNRSFIFGRVRRDTARKSESGRNDKNSDRRKFHRSSKGAKSTTKKADPPPGQIRF